MTDDQVPKVDQTHQKKAKKMKKKKSQSEPSSVDMYVDVDIPSEDYNSQPIVIEGGDATLELT